MNHAALAFLHLVRFPNLLLLAISLFFARRVLAPDCSCSLLETCFWIGAVVCTAAGGYAVNDWKDLAVDRINKPARPLPSGKIKSEVAKNVAVILFFAALTAAIAAGRPTFVLLILAAVVGLIAYAFVLKCTPLTGNILIAALSAASFASLMLFCDKVHAGLYELIVFGFLTHLLREQVKCLEDEPGDRTAGCRTLPVAIGMSGARRAAFITNLVLAAACAVTAFGKVAEIAPVWLLFSALMIIFARYLQTARTSQAFAALSRVLKWFMAAGIIAVLGEVTFCK